MNFLRSKYTKSFLGAISLIFIMLLSASLLFQYNILNSDQSTFSTSGFVVSLIIFFIIGFFAANSISKRGLIFGMLFGLIIVSLVMLFKFLGLNEGTTSSSLIRAVIQILSSGLGGFIGVNIFPIFKQK